MARPASRRICVSILIILFLLVFTWFELLPCISEANRVDSFSPYSPQRSPLHDSKSYQSPWILWQANLDEIALLQNIIIKSRNREVPKDSREVGNKSFLSFYKSTAGYPAISVHIIDFSVFEFSGCQACLHLDIPPPYNPAYL